MFLDINITPSILLVGRGKGKRVLYLKFCPRRTKKRDIYQHFWVLLVTIDKE